MPARTAAPRRQEVAVLGAGIQGVCVALAAAARGHTVSLIDRAPDCLLRTSLRNEGKIHLGFTYANDSSLKTSQLMLETALRFAPLIDDWLPAPVDWESLLSPQFTYLVMEDSLVPADRLWEHYSAIETAYVDSAAGGHYLGRRPLRLWAEASVPAGVARERVSAAAATAEVSIDLDAFRTVLRAALHGTSAISRHYGRHVNSVTRRGSGFVTGGRSTDGEPWQLDSDVVVNCLWDGRMPFDAAMGLRLPTSWVHRLKYRVLAALPGHLSTLPALTMVLGPYGDVVPMGERSYVSWYPAGRVGWSTGVTPPESWLPATEGAPDPAVAAQVASATLEALDTFIPGFAGARVTSVDAGVITTIGDTDIDDPDSALHERHDVGVRHVDGYFSIDTGKLGCAPTFAAEVADRL